MQSKPAVASVHITKLEQTKGEDGKKLFKLIDSAPTKDESKVGVPWSVERGMMLDAAEHAQPRPESPQPETWDDGYEIGPPVDLREQLFEKPPESMLNDGEFN
jgi:hypothetical protein